MLRVGWYRFRTTLARRAAGYVTLIVLIALLGGIAIAAVAGARRTQSSFPAFYRGTKPSDLSIPTAAFGVTGNTGYDAANVAKVAGIPRVKRVASAAGLNDSLLAPDGSELGRPADAPENFFLQTEGSVDGFGFDQDRITITRGRTADPSRADELVMSESIARIMHISVGDVLHVGFYTNAQEAAPGPSGDEWRPNAFRRADIKVVGFGVLNSSIVQDDIDAAAANFVLFTPALTRPLLQCCASSTQTGLVLEHGARDVPAVEHELVRAFPILATHFDVPSLNVQKAERAIKPESIALAVFGFVAALAALLIAAQLLARQLRSGAGDRDTLRVLGATRAMLMGDALLGITGAVGLAALLAAVIAIALSPLTPIGPVRSVYPARGLAIDWTVVGLGALVLCVALVVVAGLQAWRETTHRTRHQEVSARAGAGTARIVGATRLPAPAAAGTLFALEPAGGRNAAPIRSAILGTALALVIVVTTLTFGTSLHTLVGKPALYGWNWNEELSGGGGVGAVPETLAAADLAKDRDVAAWSGVYFGVSDINGVTTPALAETPGSAVAPPLLSGHGVDAAGEIVLGPNTLAALHKHVGDRVSVNTGAAKSADLVIVGTASMPAIGGSGSGSAHMEMGTGALFATQLIPSSLQDPSGNTPHGPNAYLVRFTPGVDPRAATASLSKIANGLSLPTNWGVTVVPVQRPAEIVNYRAMTSTPLVLGGALAVGAVVALALTLVASVRHRRHDLALLKTFGFTRWQLAAVVAWQSSVAVVIGAVIGIPAGVLLGRALWTLFAREISAVPQVTAPVGAIALIALSALVLANLVAAVPAFQAARTKTAMLVRDV